MASSIGVIAALGSTASWAVSAIVFKKLGEKLPPVGMTTAKALLSAFLLLLYIVLTSQGLNLNIDTNAISKLAISGAIGIAIGDSCFFAALQRLSPIVLSIILFVGPDIFSGVLGLIILGENPILPVWIGIFLVLVGLGFLIFPIKEKNSTNLKTTMFGIVLALTSLLCTSTSMVIIKPVLTNLSTITATMYRMLFGGIILLLYGLFTNKTTQWQKPFKNGEYKWGFLGAVALVAFGGFWLSLFAIKNCDLIVASTLMALEPLFIILFMVILYKHKPIFKEYCGILTAVIGIITIYIFSI